MAIRVIRCARPLEDPNVLALKELLHGGGLTAAGEGPLDVPAIVREIIAEVAAGGDEAVVQLTERIDKVRLSPDELRVPSERIRAAHAAAEPEFLELTRRIVANIRAYQQHIKLADPPDLIRGGRRLGVRYTPMDRAGVYVPGWKAVYPSSVLMAVVPAQVAGVGEIALAGPPTETGVNEMTLALAGELGITEVYRLGGAVAVAALALGTERIRPVQIVAGPGNAFVAEAKMQLAGRVAIDGVAGASEVLIVADESADAAHLAADLLAQAEHDPGSAVLVTTSAGLAEAVAGELERQLTGLQRAEAARHAMDAYSAIIVVDGPAAACEVANAFAPEHLQIITRDDRAVLEGIRHAGAIFLGPHTPVPLGDYVAGPSHVLPTRGTAMMSGPLSANSFLKASSVIRYDQAALSEDASDTIAMARREGLSAHARAVQIRLD